MSNISQQMRPYLTPFRHFERDLRYDPKALPRRATPSINWSVS